MLCTTAKRGVRAECRSPHGPEVQHAQHLADIIFHTHSDTTSQCCSLVAHKSGSDWGSADARHPKLMWGRPEALQVALQDQQWRSPSLRPKAPSLDAALAAVGVNSRAPLSVRPRLDGLLCAALF